MPVIIAWIVKFAASSLFKYVVLPGIIVGALGVGYAVITTGAYNRGEAAGIAKVTAQMKAAIEKQRQEVVKDFARLKSLDRPALERELWQKCMAAPNGSEAVCGVKP